MSSKPLAGRRILVVEDELMILMLVEDMLAELGCTSITSAATVEQALALIDEKDFDAATLDVNLHGIKSFPIADALIARCVPFMFATGFGAEGVPARYNEQTVLRKPFRYQDVSDQFQRLLNC
ncbi:response regulator [Stutzerimonas nitrititolerans]|jgi:CheY-like chemotaxis protein|uniref:response regulator n=1 Tax=Stutzerimonas nitrititolerans TaxID=2482751 RepID=UPI0013E32BE1|nr:response regulator [Stutzerimonas nitrititolerans]